MPRVTPEAVKAEILRRLQAGESQRSISADLRVSHVTVRKLGRDLSRTPSPTSTSKRPAASTSGPTSKASRPDPPTPTEAVEAEAEKITLARIQGRERELIKVAARERSFRAFLQELVEDVAPRLKPGPAYRPPASKLKVTTETALLHLSDWHAYETVRPDRVLGLNEYTARVFGQRARHVTESGISIVNKLERGGWSVPDLVVACNGDFISGTIHEVERHSDCDNVILAAFGCGQVLANSLRDLAARFRSVHVIGTSGNHGRLPDARKMQMKDPTRSWDTAIYLYAMAALRDVPNVRFTLPDSYAVCYEIEGHTFYQGHGHDIKSWNSIPFYGIQRMTNGLNALRVAANQAINYWLFGHFHTPGSLETAGGEIFVNGCLIGPTEFGVNGLGRGGKPRQDLLMVHRDHGVTSRWPLLAATAPDFEGYDTDPWAYVA